MKKYYKFGDKEIEKDIKKYKEKGYKVKPFYVLQVE